MLAATSLMKQTYLWMQKGIVMLNEWVQRFCLPRTVDYHYIYYIIGPFHSLHPDSTLCWLSCNFSAKRASYGAIQKAKQRASLSSPCSINKGLSGSRLGISMLRLPVFGLDVKFLALYHAIRRMLSKGRMNNLGECYHKENSNGSGNIT